MKTLNIKRDPIEQGFKEALYNLIIASNVIHATSQLSNILANMRRLFKPEGKFALIKIIYFTPLYIITFGLLSNWWKGE